MITQLVTLSPFQRKLSTSPYVRPQICYRLRTSQKAIFHPLMKREKGARAVPSARSVPVILAFRSRGAETLADVLSPSQLRFPSQGGQLSRLLLSQSLRFLSLPCFHQSKCLTVEGIKGDARAENIISGHSSPSQIVTIPLLGTHRPLELRFKSLSPPQIVYAQ